MDFTTFSRPQKLTRYGITSEHYYVRVNEGGRRTWRSTGQTKLQLAKEVVETWRLRDAKGERCLEHEVSSNPRVEGFANRESRASPDTLHEAIKNIEENSLLFNIIKEACNSICEYSDSYKSNEGMIFYKTEQRVLSFIIRLLEDSEKLINKLKNTLKIKNDSKSLFNVIKRRRAYINSKIKMLQADRYKLERRVNVLNTRILLSEDFKMPEVPMNFRKVTMDNDPAIPEASGVYFIWDESGKIVYVGQSINLRQRITLSHHKACEGDRASYLVCKEEDRFWYENFYIWKCRPERNGHV